MNFDQISPKSMEYLAKIAESPNKFEELTLQFITNRESDNLKVPEFSDKYEWLNTSDKLSFDGNLKKKLCVLDFFTYCCINCMHVLPQLHELESKHTIEDGLAVIGVHSAKFPNEKVVDNILSAVLRYDISHPVLNDGEAELWNAMSIRCWPTFVIVSPEGIPLLYLVGETHKETLFKFVEIALKYYGDKGMISNHTLPISLAKDNLKTGLLKFPGKIAIDKSGTHFAVSNTGNHNILLFDDTGIVYSKIGTGTPGFVDGSSAHAQFNAPQGLSWHGDDIYVADTENHAIRKIDATTGLVTTITGTGLQGDDKEGGKSGTEQELSSPWDVEFASAPGVDQDKEEGPKNCMYIAAAGTHQIWSYFLEDGSWLKKGSQTERTCIRFAGSGNEENRNNSYPHKASFAQPSHLSLGKVKGQNVLFVADSESSSVRTVELKSGAVKACVGGERDPMNLFAYGDQDGKSVDAKLQHPLAVVYDQQDDVVYVADSYNHKIKKIEASKNTCSTLTIRGGVGSTDGQMAECQFNEPGGLALHPHKRLLYVADTNNHRIRVIDLEKNTCTTLPLIESDSKDSPVPLEFKALVNIQRNPPTVLEKITRDLSSVVSARVQLVFPEHLHFTEGVNSKVQLSLSDMDGEVISFESGEIEREKKTFGCNLSTHHANKDLLLKVEMILYVCIGESCMMKSYVIQQHVTHDVTTTNDIIEIEHQVVV